MKLLIVNPNISESVTQLIENEARRAASKETVLVSKTAPFGVAYIETPGEAAVGAYATLETLAQHYSGFDAAIIAAFGDPGIMEAKEILPIPVVGLTESALATVFLLGGRFAIVGISKRIGAWYEQTVQEMGMSARFNGYYGLGQGFADIATVQHEAEAVFIKMCHECVEEGADAIILAGAPLAGLAHKVAHQIPVPLVDGVGSAVRMAEVMARSNFVVRQKGGMSAPPTKPCHGMSNELAALIGRQII